MTATLPEISSFMSSAGSLITVLLAALLFRRQGEDRKTAATERETAATKLGQVHDLVDGVSKELKAANSKADFTAGEKAGIASERAEPMVPLATAVASAAAAAETTLPPKPKPKTKKP